METPVHSERCTADSEAVLAEHLHAPPFGNAVLGSAPASMHPLYDP
jgi:hypothetical protein